MSETNQTPEEFMEYFRSNYPGPNTIIRNPDWHAPKIYRAALHASGHAELYEALKRVIQNHCPDEQFFCGSCTEARKVLAKARGEQ